MKYILHGFYQTDLSLGRKEPKSDDSPMNFKKKFESIYSLTGHIEGMNLIKGTYTFIIEVKEDEEEIEKKEEELKELKEDLAKLF